MATSGTRRICCRSTKEFFGLHQAVSAFARLTGLPLWPAGLTVVVLAHILSVLAVYQLGRMLGVPAPGAAVGAVVYTLNPSWMYFDTAVSYESLALPLVLWCLAATVGAGRATEKPALRSIAPAILCVAALPMIHHVSTIMLCLILTLLITARLVPWFPRAAAGELGTSRERLWPLVLIWSCLLLSVYFWWSEKSDWLVGYLAPALTEGFSQLRKILSGVGRSSGGSGRCSLTPRTRFTRSSPATCSRSWCWRCSCGLSQFCGATGAVPARRHGPSRSWA